MVQHTIIAIISIAIIGIYPGFHPADKGLHRCVHQALIRQAGEGFFFELKRRLA